MDYIPLFVHYTSTSYAQCEHHISVHRRVLVPTSAYKFQLSGVNYGEGKMFHMFGHTACTCRQKFKCTRQPRSHFEIRPRQCSPFGNIHFIQLFSTSLTLLVKILTSDQVDFRKNRRKDQEAKVGLFGP
jgi:hypothetical protein